MADAGSNPTYGSDLITEDDDAVDNFIVVKNHRNHVEKKLEVLHETQAEGKLGMSIKTAMQKKMAVLQSELQAGRARRPSPRMVFP